MAYLSLKNVTKEYHSGEVTIKALSGVNLEIEEGELCVIVGPSGAGKTTLLNILGGMDCCTGGEVVLDGEHIEKYDRKALTTYRRDTVGFVFQFYNLVQNLTALENVELASQICKDPLPPKDVLIQVGLGERLSNFPAQLSGGEQQRVAIARALAKNPKLMLCDEPTGALDYNTSKEILKLIEEVNKKYGNTIIMVTHNEAIKNMADHVIKLRDGAVRHNDINTNKVSAEDLLVGIPALDHLAVGIIADPLAAVRFLVRVP